MPELWSLAHTVRSKLLSLAAEPDPPLCTMVGHANLFDRLVSELHGRGTDKSEFDIEAGNVVEVCLDPSDSESDESTDSDYSYAESDSSTTADCNGVEFG